MTSELVAGRVTDMTRTDVALMALKSLTLSRRTHLDVMGIMNAMKLTTDEAVELRKMVGREWSDVVDRDSDQVEVWGIAKDVTNSYARNVSLR